jgi:predicted transcriptional regulator
MNTILLTGIVVAAALGSGAGYFVYQNWDVDYAPAGSCTASTPMTNGREGSGLIRFAVSNEGPAQTASFCLLSRDHSLVAATTFSFEAGERRVVDLRASPGSYLAHIDFGDPRVGYGMGSTNPNLFMCADRAARVDVVLYSPGIMVQGADCFSPDPEPVTQGFDRNVVVPGDALQGPAGPAVAVGVAVAGLVAALVYFRSRIHLLALVLFTRLVRPRVLDLPTRQRIHDLVSAEPGIHANAIAERLDLAGGETLYHLRVLAREGVLQRVDSWGRRQYFVAGRYGRAQMGSLAALQLPALARLYGLVVETPGGSLTEIARRAGLSVGRVSRLSRRLERAGLVERHAHGRELRLVPLPGPSSRS